MDRPKRILILDDDVSFTRLMKMNLEANGAYEVHVENSPARALVAAGAARPDLILLDVLMPEPEGPKIAAAIRQNPQLQSIPIVFLTAVISRNRTIASQRGAPPQEFLSKPISVEDLIGTIERLIP